VRGGRSKVPQGSRGASSRFSRSCDPRHGRELRWLSPQGQYCPRTTHMPLPLHCRFEFEDRQRAGSPGSSSFETFDEDLCRDFESPRQRGGLGAEPPSRDRLMSRSRTRFDPWVGQVAAAGDRAPVCLR
jgi:hypothetical protein